MKIGERLEAELRRLLPNVRVTEVSCAGDATPARNKRLTCVVRHEGNPDRYVELTFTDATGSFRWGRKYVGNAFDARLVTLLRSRLPLPISGVRCPEDMVAYVDTRHVCEVFVRGQKSERVRVTWKSKLGKVSIERLTDVAALERQIGVELRERGVEVESVRCPEQITVSKQTFECAIHRRGGTSTIQVTAERGRASIELPAAAMGRSEVPENKKREK